MNFKKLICLFCCCAAACGFLFGQKKGSITGVVRDAATGEHLPFVNILRSENEGTATELEGGFEMPNLAPGTYVLTASCIGYQQAVLKDVKVEGGQKTTVAFELEPIVILGDEAIVTATRMPQAAKLAPASVALITSQQINEKHISTFDQAFDETPGVVVTRSSGANVQAFSIRGASEVAGGGIGNRVLLLIDGRPALSPESAGALWNLVPLNSIDHIEVVKGAYSSLYGSSAMGGVVNVITRNPALEPKTKVHLNYGFYEKQPKSFGGYRYNDFYTLEASHSRSFKRFSYLLDGGWKHNDGHREKSAFDLLNFYGKGAWALNGNRHVQITLNANRIHNDTPATWFSFNQPYSVADYRKDDYQKRREYNADFYYYALPSAKVKYSTRVFYYQNSSKYSFNDDPGNDSTNVNIGKQIIGESSIMAQRVGNISQVDWFINDRHAFLVGTDFNFDHVVGLPDTVLYGRHNALNLGAYMQDEWSVAPNFTATLGARVDHYRILSEFHETNFSPKMAFLFQPKKSLGVRMLLAQAFRTPAMAERFIKFEQGGGLGFQPNPDLRSEKLVLSTEVGAKWSLRNRSSFDVALFYNKYRDLISFQQLSKPFEPLLYRVINLKEAVMQGFEVAYQRRWGNKARLNIGYTYLDARDVSTGRLNDDLAYKMKHTLSVATTAYFGTFTCNVNARYRSDIKEVFIYPGSEPDAAFLLNAKIGWQPIKQAQFYLAMDNLTNTQYEELERYRMPGRNYTAGVSWEF
ncbi:MAG: TonB-dependent receptor [Saprospiraceae bacterium]|nr:TonB-dependent receptor [Saprospiraceae bacterium]MCF8250803.1 TonB-dependent receptor [Saprospiraceae bacterium]MCF8312604.1 TonB-dependent receptor [Saprospiraceae bacterium]MCF8440933.1 TonB-dependent receptor [Saprospiraceae bacterium]